MKKIDDLITHLNLVGRDFLDERRIGWGFIDRRGQGEEIFRLLYVGPDKSGLTLQEAIELALLALFNRASDPDLEPLGDFTSDIFLSDTGEPEGFIFVHRTR